MNCSEYNHQLLSIMNGSGIIAVDGDVDDDVDSIKLMFPTEFKPPIMIRHLKFDRLNESNN